MKTILLWLQQNRGEWLNLGHFSIILYTTSGFGVRMNKGGLMILDDRPRETVNGLAKFLRAADVEMQNH